LSDKTIRKLHPVKNELLKEWVGHVVRMADSRIPQKGNGSMFQRKKACGKAYKFAGRCYLEGRCRFIPDTEMEGAARKTEARRLRRPWPTNWPNYHRRRVRRNKNDSGNTTKPDLSLT
jgi:hypothetical protein